MSTATAPAAGEASAARTPGPRRRRRSAAQAAPQQGVRTRAATAYLLLAPNLVLFALFLLLPLVAALALSLASTTGVGPTEWVGLGNYERLAGDAVFWRSTANTAVLVLLTVPASLALGLLLAVMLDKPVRGRGLFRTVFYLPYVLSGVVIAIAGRWIFNENIGVVNRVLEAVGLERIAWQSGTVPAFVSVAVMLTWARLGFCMVVYLAGLQGVPRELHEAASIDGASGWQRFRHVTWPLLRPTTFFLVVMMVIECFQVFDLVYVMTGGGPGNATQFLPTYAYAVGFGARQQGLGAAIGMVMYVLVLAGTVLWWRARKAQEAEA